MTPPGSLLCTEGARLVPSDPHERPSSLPLVVRLAVVLVLKEEVFISAVYRKCHGRYAQAGEASLESVPPAEEPAVSPCLAVFQTLAFARQRRH